MYDGMRDLTILKHGIWDKSLKNRCEAGFLSLAGQKSLVGWWTYAQLLWTLFGSSEITHSLGKQ